MAKAQPTFSTPDNGSPAGAAAAGLLPNRTRTGNRLLDQLGAEPFGRLKPHLSADALHRNQRLWEPGKPITHVYFPECGVISVLVTMRDGGTTEVGMVGREGMLGIPIALGDDIAINDARVVLPGTALHIPARALREQMEESPQLRMILLRYAQACFNSATRSAACNRVHILEQRLARWLLTARARSGQDELAVTHEVIANHLGVRRAGVTVAAQSLQSAGLIHYAHGRVTISDAVGLKAASCECNGFIEDEYGRLLDEKAGRARFAFAKDGSPMTHPPDFAQNRGSERRAQNGRPE